MRKRILSVISLGIVSVFAVWVLYVFSPASRNISNGFKRLIKTNVVTTVRKIDLGFNSFYIAGLSSKYIYLGNYTTPLRLLLIDLRTYDTLYWKLSIPLLDSANNKYCIIQVDSPNIYATDYASRYFYHSIISENRFSPVQKIPISFSNDIVISPTTQIIRVRDTTLKENILEKYTNGNLVSRNSDILIKQLDGYFCTDGRFIRNIKENTLYYLFFYKNKFARIDTNLAIIYTGNTIDTNTIVKLKISSIKSENSIVMSSPPLIVNKYAWIHNGNLFVNSNLKSETDLNREFLHSSVIDAYDENTGRYKFSYYIPEIDGKKFVEIGETDDNLVSIHSHYLIVSKLKLAN